MNAQQIYDMQQDLIRVRWMKTIPRQFRAAGISGPLDQAAKDKIIEMSQQGFTTGDIAEAVGVSTKSVSTVLCGNVTYRAKLVTSFDERQRRVLAMFADGATIAEISRDLQTCNKTVRRILRRCGAIE